MSGERARRRDGLVQFLRGIQKAGLPVEALGDDDGLVASGIIDSLALLEIVTYLEETYGLDFAARGIDPEELSAIGRILDLIDRQRPAPA
jgi:acyl carrier protein